MGVGVLNTHKMLVWIRMSPGGTLGPLDMVWDQHLEMLEHWLDPGGALNHPRWIQRFTFSRIHEGPFKSPTMHIYKRYAAAGQKKYFSRTQNGDIQ